MTVNVILHAPPWKYSGCSKNSKPHPDFRFVAHYSALYGPQLHRYEDRNLGNMH